jgi:hypothetical protein
VLESYHAAIFPLYLRLPRKEDGDEELLNRLGPDHVRALWKGRYSAGTWAVSALRGLCELRPDFINEVKTICDGANGVERIALLSCMDVNSNVIRDELERLASLPDAELSRQPFEIMRLTDIDWAETGSLYPRLLVRNIERLRKSLLGGSTHIEIKGLNRLGLDVMTPVTTLGSRTPRENWWERRQLGSIVARYGNQEVRAFLLHEVGNGESTIRHWIKDAVLPYLEDPSALTETDGSA